MVTVTAEEISRPENVKAEDIVIAFMGLTGSGKSNFIDTLVGDHNKRTGHKLQSCSDKVRITRVRNHPDKGDRIVLVDTPGFDNTYKSEMDVLKIIADWLVKTYKKKVKLTGIIYLHRISDNRMAGMPHKNIRMFGELCGEKGAKRVMLATTMWDRIRKDVGEQRQKELEEKYWRAMLEWGAHTTRFGNTQEDGWRILDELIKRVEDVHEGILIQEELVDQGKQLVETKAGGEVSLFASVQEVRDEGKATMDLLEEQAKHKAPAKAPENVR